MSAVSTMPGRMTWEPGWLRAVEDFAQELQARGYSPYTLRDYRGDLLRAGAELRWSPERFGAADVEAAERKDKSEGLTIAACRRRTSAYRKFLAYLERREDLTTLCLELLELVEQEPASDRVLVGLVYFTGLRLVEVADLEGRDLREQAGELRCRAGCRIVPLHPRLAVWLEALRNEVPRMPYRPLLPGHQGYAPNARTLHARFARLVGRLGLAPEIKPDAMRREAAQRLLGMGAAAPLIRVFLAQDRGRIGGPRRSGLADLMSLRPQVLRLALPSRPKEEAG